MKKESKQKHYIYKIINKPEGTDYVVGSEVYSLVPNTVHLWVNMNKGRSLQQYDTDYLVNEKYIEFVKYGDFRRFEDIL